MLIVYSRPLARFYANDSDWRPRPTFEMTDYDFRLILSWSWFYANDSDWRPRPAFELTDYDFRLILGWLYRLNVGVGLVQVVIQVVIGRYLLL